MMTQKRKTICMQLQERFGGEWKHFPFHGRWQCNDGNRVVQTVSAGVDEWDKELGPGNYYLYDGNEPGLFIGVVGCGIFSEM